MMTSASRAASGAPSSEATLNLRTAKPCVDSTSVRNPRSIGSSSMRRTRMAFGSLTEARSAGAGASKATTFCSRAAVILKSLPLGCVLESKTGRESTPRLPASRQSSVVTRDDADRACPRAERATYRNVVHPRLPYRPGCLPSGTPAVRASRALPTANLANRTIAWRDQIVPCAHDAHSKEYPNWLPLPRNCQRPAGCFLVSLSRRDPHVEDAGSSFQLSTD